jgi:putative phosphoribosyl transferase
MNRGEEQTEAGRCLDRRFWSFDRPLFRDRFDAGRQLAATLENERVGDVVVVGLARGGVQVAAGVARAFEAPLDVVAVRKVKHPWQPEYAIGAVTPGDGVYLRSRNGLSAAQVARAVASARRAAEELDRRLHLRRSPASLRGRSALVVDDGLATGATMIAAARWARAAGAKRIVAAVPVAPIATAKIVRAEVDDLVVLYELQSFGAVGSWFEDFSQVGDDDVLRLLDELADDDTCRDVNEDGSRVPCRA